MIRAELAALPNLQSISIAGPGVAACLPYGPIPSTTFSQLTSIRLGTIISGPAQFVQLLRGFPASLPQLRLDVDMKQMDWILQLQQGVQMAHLTALTTLHVTGKRFVIGEESTLPPNLIINLTVPWVMHARPLMQLSRLQRLDVRSIDHQRPDGFAGVAQCLTQLTYMNIDMLYIADENAPQELMLSVAAVRMLSLRRPRLIGDVEDSESLAEAIVGLEQLRLLSAPVRWFGSGYAEGDQPHPIMRLQAATQLTRLDLFELKSDPEKQIPDWKALLDSLPDVEMGGELAALKGQ
ncbi:hypothetical protein OEZ86_012327 [Tetradesmus obliquus]|nr:hypothetical protein OEZ86_012327 [Tetradesmus obliquus]